ncbi:MAG: PEP-utilizing enzyme [Nitrososphaerales archaeon]
MNAEDEYVFGSKVIGKFFGDTKFPVEWSNEDEKKLHWWFDDLHCPHPLSFMYENIGVTASWNVRYAFRRFRFPQSKDWIQKLFNRYLHTALIPREPEEAKRYEAYYNMIFPVYIKKFPEWWKTRYEPELKRNLDYLDNFDYEKASLAELMVLLEDALDINDRHWEIHWILNFAQFFSFIRFRQVYAEIFGEIKEEDEEEIQKMLTSFEDKNWDAIKHLWLMKERVKASPNLTNIFKRENAKEILEALNKDSEGKEFMLEFEEFLKEFGAKAIYAHEYIYPTWRDEPSAVIELIRTYLIMDYNFYEHFYRLKNVRDEAIKKMFDREMKEEQRKKLSEALNDALTLAPLTPNHHFYIDQGTNARMRQVFLEIGKKLVKENVIDKPEDIFFLYYEELRDIASNPNFLNAKVLIERRRKEWEEAHKLIPPPFLGTVTEWSAKEEAWKVGLWGWQLPEPTKKVKEDLLHGLAASPGVVEGIARVVVSVEEFDKVKPGDILVCDMTNPAWVPLFPKIKGLVTDSGGLLSHPAITAREFRIPAVIGTAMATKKVKSGQRIRVDGSKGIVEILK